MSVRNSMFRGAAAGGTLKRVLLVLYLLWTISFSVLVQAFLVGQNRLPYPHDDGAKKTTLATASYFKSFRNRPPITAVLKLMQDDDGETNGEFGMWNAINDDKNDTNNDAATTVNGKNGKRSQSVSSSADLYSMNELASILNLHQTLKDNHAFGNRGVGDGGGLHDFVLQTLQQQQQDELEDEADTLLRLSTPIPIPPPPTLSASLTERMRDICAIISDVDGTLLDKNHELHPLTRQALIRAVAATTSKDSSLRYVFPATGKTRVGAMASLGSDISALLNDGKPGVYIQGLYCLDAQGRVVFEQTLQSPDLFAQTEQMAQENNYTTLLAYQGDVVYASAMASHPHHIQAVHDKFGEPRPVVLDQSLADYYQMTGRGFHKLLLMTDTPEQVQALRPAVQTEIANRYNATLTVAVPVMLEILPPHSGKAKGVQQLCRQALQLDVATHVLALGDGENDLEFLQQAAIGVAMGNAVDLVKQAPGVDVVLHETNSQGGAGLAMEWFGGLQQQQQQQQQQE